MGRGGSPVAVSKGKNGSGGGLRGSLAGPASKTPQRGRLNRSQSSVGFSHGRGVALSAGGPRAQSPPVVPPRDGIGIGSSSSHPRPLGIVRGRKPLRDGGALSGSFGRVISGTAGVKVMNNSRAVVKGARQGGQVGTSINARPRRHSFAEGEDIAGTNPDAAGERNGPMSERGTSAERSWKECSEVAARDAVMNDENDSGFAGPLGDDKLKIYQGGGGNVWNNYP